MDIAEFIYQSNMCSDTDDLISIFLKFIGQFGLNSFMMAGLSHDSTADKEENLGILVNYPDEWMERYRLNHYVDHDPVYLKALSSGGTYTWARIMEENNSKKGLRVMNEAREFGLCDGMGVTLYGPSGSMTGIGFAGPEKAARCDSDALCLVNMASNQLYTVYADMRGKGRIKTEAAEATLTDREREVLTWVAIGKTKPEIADRLSVSESCVKRHCENIFFKLEAGSLASAVFKALRMGLISPY